MIRDPWSVIRDAVSLISRALNTVHGPLLMDYGTLLRKPGSCAFGDFIGIGRKGTRVSLVGRRPHGPRTKALGPLLKGLETRLTDGFPVTRFMLFEQTVTHFVAAVTRTVRLNIPIVQNHTGVLPMVGQMMAVSQKSKKLTYPLYYCYGLL